MKHRMQCLNCGRSLKLSGGRDRSGKKHAHCKNCKLEWHIPDIGFPYSHSYIRK